MSFSQSLASLRRKKRLSQMALSNLTGVSQRHISFLESGRAKPGAPTLRKLVAGLELAFSEANQLYLSAGLAAPHAKFSLQDEAFKPAIDAIQTLLQNHLPNPAIATLRSGEIVLTNKAFDQILAWAFSETPDPTVDLHNLYDLTLHPAGLRQFMGNSNEILPHTLRRLHNAARSDAAAQVTLNRCMSFSGVSAFAKLDELESASLSSVLVEHYLVRERRFSFVSMVAAFGSPEDVTAQNVQLELFFPADDETLQSLRAIR